MASIGPPTSSMSCFIMPKTSRKILALLGMLTKDSASVCRFMTSGSASHILPGSSSQRPLVGRTFWRFMMTWGFALAPLLSSAARIDEFALTCMSRNS